MFCDGWWKETWVVECVSGLKLTFYNQLLGLSSKFLVNSCPPTNGDRQKVFTFRIGKNFVSKKCKTKIRSEAQLARLASASLTNPLVAAQMRLVGMGHLRGLGASPSGKGNADLTMLNVLLYIVTTVASYICTLHFALKVQTVLISVQCPLAGTRVA